MQLILKTPLFCIVKGNGEMVMNTLTESKERLAMLLDDRQANGDAFPRECISEVDLSIQWFNGLQTTGEKSVSAYFFPSTKSPE